jgi:hypothetical protein
MFSFSFSNRIFQIPTDRDVVETYETESQISKAVSYVANSASVDFVSINPSTI